MTFLGTYKKLVFLMILSSIVVFSFSTASAIEIRLSQESTSGAGDFNSNILGNINQFSTALTAAGFYQYNTPNAASYNGDLNGGPSPMSSMSQFFLLDAADGLSLVVVHDNVGDGSGFSTRTRWTLLGDTAGVLLSDDPAEGMISVGGTFFESTKNAAACCTDGYAIGPLDGMWTLFGEFVTMPTGIDTWGAVSSDFSTIILSLQPGRRVKLELLPGPIPEPSTILLLGSGLAGLVWYSRKRKKS